MLALEHPLAATLGVAAPEDVMVDGANNGGQDPAPHRAVAGATAQRSDRCHEKELFVGRDDVLVGEEWSREQACPGRDWLRYARRRGAQQHADQRLESQPVATSKCLVCTVSE